MKNKINSRRKFIKSISTAGLLGTILKTSKVYCITNEHVRQVAVFTPTAKDEYLAPIKRELENEWPNNRTINIVFHGHSVPSGYFVTPDVKPLQSYPFLLLKELKK